MATVTELIEQIDLQIGLLESRLRDNSLEITAQKMRLKLVRYFEAQRKRVLERFKDLQESKDGEAKALREKAYTQLLITIEEGEVEINLFESKADDWTKYIYSTESEADAFGLEMTLLFEEAFRKGGNRAVEQLILSFGFDVRYERAEEWIRGHVTKLATLSAEQITETTDKLLRSQLAEAFELGEGIPEIEGRIQDIFNFSKAYRAEVIARTECSTAYNSAKFEEYKENGVEKKSWFWSGTEERCPTGVCEDNARQGPIPIDEAFLSGDMAPPAHPNCTCDLIPEIEI